jgi:penicillin-binding protein 1A
MSARRVLTRAGVVVAALLIAAYLLVGVLAAGQATYVYDNRGHLPDLGPFTRFEFSTVGHIYDAFDTPLIELAHEYREITPYGQIPPVVRDAILAAEDKRFFSHDGIDYTSVPRVLAKVRGGMLAERLLRGGRHDELAGSALFPQGGSTITQQVVRGIFLSRKVALENSYELRSAGRMARVLASVIGARGVNMLARKREEMRLSIWLEQRMRVEFGSKRRAKEEILARYASFVYMGNGQYGFARAAQYYFGRPLSTFTAADADKAALLAGILKSPRDNAPQRKDAGQQRPHSLRAPAVVEHVLAEFKSRHPELGLEDVLQGRIQLYATADSRVQDIVNDALEHGLERYEQRHPQSRGIIQGAVVVLHNSDGRILAETGGRRVFNGRSASYSDYNRVTRSLRQPGSAMKPIVYLTAFRQGELTLDTLVPDEPISVSDGDGRPLKWIANYDGRFKGMIPVRQALAESSNAVAIWIAARVGINSVLRTSRSLGVTTPLQRYPTTALGASEVTLLELANAYRTMASGIVAEPYVLRAAVRESGEALPTTRPEPARAAIDSAALALIQEGLRGVVRLPGGTAQRLSARAFPIAVMGKTGTTNEFRDAIFVGSTYGAGGITAAVRIGFDDNRSLGARETGGRVALPVFQELMLAIYGDPMRGPAPLFPAGMEERITAALTPPAVLAATAAGFETEPRTRRAAPLAAELEWLMKNRTIIIPATRGDPFPPRTPK